MEIKTLLIPNDWLRRIPELSVGYANGYVGVPPGHPWHGKQYELIDNVVNIHGGLTYGQDHAPKQEPDGYWWFGFDTCHYLDNENNWPERDCRAELESLKRQAENAINTK